MTFKAFKDYIKHTSEGGRSKAIKRLYRRPALKEAMSGRNTRAIHTDHKTIAHNLKRHVELMRKYEAQGMTKEAASKRAYQEITRKK